MDCEWNFCFLAPGATSSTKMYYQPIQHKPTPPRNYVVLLQSHSFQVQLCMHTLFLLTNGVKSCSDISNWSYRHGTCIQLVFTNNMPGALRAT